MYAISGKRPFTYSTDNSPTEGVLKNSHSLQGGHEVCSNITQKYKMLVEEEKHLDLGWYGGVVDERKKVGEPDTSNKAGEAQLKQEVFMKRYKRQIC